MGVARTASLSLPSPVRACRAVWSASLLSLASLLHKLITAARVCPPGSALQVCTEAVACPLRRRLSALLSCPLLPSPWGPVPTTLGQSPPHLISPSPSPPVSLIYNLTHFSSSAYRFLSVVFESIVSSKYSSRSARRRCRVRALHTAGGDISLWLGGPPSTPHCVHYVSLSTCAAPFYGAAAPRARHCGARSRPKVHPAPSPRPALHSQKLATRTRNRTGLEFLGGHTERI